MSIGDWNGKGRERRIVECWLTDLSVQLAKQDVIWCYGVSAWKEKAYLLRGGIMDVLYSVDCHCERFSP